MAPRVSKISLEKIASAFRENPFLTLQKIEPFDINSAIFDEAKMIVSCKPEREPLVKSFIIYLNAQLASLGSEITFRNSYIQVKESRVFSLYRLHPIKHLSREDYQKECDQIFHSLPSFIKDFYQKNKN